MKPNATLLKIWEDKENSYKEFYEFELLSNEEKMKTFDLIQKRKIALREIGLKDLEIKDNTLIQGNNVMKGGKEKDE